MEDAEIFLKTHILGNKRHLLRSRSHVLLHFSSKETAIEVSRSLKRDIDKYLENFDNNQVLVDQHWLSTSKLILEAENGKLTSCYSILKEYQPNSVENPRLRCLKLVVVQSLEVVVLAKQLGNQKSVNVFADFLTVLIKARDIFLIFTCCSDLVVQAQHFLEAVLKECNAAERVNSHPIDYFNISERAKLLELELEKTMEKEIISTVLPTLMNATKFLSRIEIKRILQVARLGPATRSLSENLYSALLKAKNSYLNSNIAELDTWSESKNSTEAVKWEWKSFVGFKEVKRRLEEIILLGEVSKTNPFISSLRIASFKGILIQGFSGCGKSLFLKNIGRNLRGSGTNVIHLSNTDILSQYFGESERNLRNHFTRARSNLPAAIIFDDIDTIFTKGDQLTHRLLTTLLNELDGIDGKRDVLFIASCSKVDTLSQALMRPGRIDTTLELGYPTEDDFASILLHNLDGLNVDPSLMADISRWVLNRYPFRKWCPSKVVAIAQRTKMAVLKDTIEALENQGNADYKITIEDLKKIVSSYADIHYI